MSKTVIRYNKYIYLYSHIVKDANGDDILAFTNEDDHFYGMSQYHNKMLLYGDSRGYGMSTPIDFESQWNTRLLKSDIIHNPSVRRKVFVVSECKRPRDLYRKDFDIVRNREDADVIVIPRPLNYVTEKTYSDKRLFKHIVLECVDEDKDDAPYTICYELKIREDIDESEDDIKDLVARSIDNLKTYFAVKYSYTIKSWSFHKTKYFGLVKDIQEYAEIYGEKMLPNKRYIYEDDMPLDTPNKLTAENLAVLWRCQDDDVVQKFIVSADWREYPFTSYRFLYAKYEEVKYRASTLKTAIRNVFDTLTHYASESTELVAPEDYALFQDFVLKLYGVDGKGFLTMDEWSSIQEKQFAKYLPVRVAIKKIKPDAPVRVCDLNKQ